MKRLLFIISTLFVLAIISYPSHLTSKVNGSPGAKTGSPSDGNDCTSCHNATTSSGSAVINSNIPFTGYVPGQTYTIIVTVTQQGISRFGFEVTAEEGNVGSNKVGTFLITNSNETKLKNNNSAVTHKQAGTIANNSKQWSFDWIAPQSGIIGGVIFYGAFIAMATIC